MAASNPMQLDKTRELIESKIDTNAIKSMEVGNAFGGVAFKSVSEVTEFAKLMSVSMQAVPKHCRNQPGVCLGIVMQAIEWRMSPFAVASKSYCVNDVIAWESQLIHAVIEQRAPIVGRLRHEYIGNGPNRQCRVWAFVDGIDEPFEYISPIISKIKPQNSPLWTTKPDLQLFYNASRDWARMHFPDVIMGVYAEDEMDDSGRTLVAEVVTDRPRLTSRAEALRQRVTPQTAPTDPVDEDPFSDEPTDVAPRSEDVDDVPGDGPDSEAPSDHPPAVPEYLQPYIADMKAASTEAQVDAAFQTHIESNGRISEAEYESACQLRDWKLEELAKTAKPKGDGKLFDANPNYD